MGALPIGSSPMRDSIAGRILSMGDSSRSIHDLPGANALIHIACLLMPRLLPFTLDQAEDYACQHQAGFCPD